jgi:hypothetical protein
VHRLDAHADRHDVGRAHLRVGAPPVEQLGVADRVGLGHGIEERLEFGTRHGALGPGGDEEGLRIDLPVNGHGGGGRADRKTEVEMQ